MNKKIEATLDYLGSVQLTLITLGLMMFLVFIGTLAQASMGTFAAQKMFFNSYIIFANIAELKFPLFPGGLSIGILWLINLLSAFIVRFRFIKRDTGILISHFGLVLLVAGQGLTQISSRESRMPIEIGQTKSYIESFREVELALIMTSDPNADQVISIPASTLNNSSDITTPFLPFKIRVRKFIPNAEIKMKSGNGRSLATQGIGMQVEAQEIPITTKDDEDNNVSAYIEILDKEKSRGVWLVSTGLGAPQSISFEGKDFRLSMRARRQYLPFDLTLKEFRHDVYPGTDIPKNFSSLVHLKNKVTGEERDTLIYMNHPLRYGGLTFYQASFGKNDTLSIFQVVENPVWVTPYISCALVVIGLAIQFLMHLIQFSRKPR